MGREGRRRSREGGRDATDLLHDTRLALGEGDVATRLVLDELDLDLPALTAGLLFIVVVGVVGTTLGAAILRCGAVAGGGGLLQLFLGGRSILLSDGRDVGHDGSKEARKRTRGWEW